MYMLLWQDMRAFSMFVHFSFTSVLLLETKMGMNFIFFCYLCIPEVSFDFL